MTHRTPSDGVSQTRRHGTSATDHSRNDARTADPDRGTEEEGGNDRAAREHRLRRSHPMPAARHE
jgi:hypothetical protein